MELPFRNHKQDLAGHFSATAQGENPWFRISILWTHFRSTITLEPLQPDRSSALLHPYFLVWSAPAGEILPHPASPSPPRLETLPRLRLRHPRHSRALPRMRSNHHRLTLRIPTITIITPHTIIPGSGTSSSVTSF